MSCILNSPEACIRLAMRVLAHQPEAEECAKAAGFAVFPNALAEQLYLENVRAFRARYQERYSHEIIPIDEFPTTVEAPSDLDAWEPLAHGLEYFKHQCAEGDYPEEPGYQFLDRLCAVAHEKSDPMILAATHIWGIP